MKVYKRTISKEVRKRLLERRTRIFTRWLKINFEKPYTIFLAAFFPFAQAFLASVIVIYTDPSKNDWKSNLALFIVAGLYYLAFAMNSKRATKDLVGISIVGCVWSFGIICGKIFLS